ncbi:MAG: hypothetical protein U9O94_06240 [Nanoarchaeota archaeon]|nr:hypothetical protein [Nanoarchaeota archaeon]
MSTNKLYLATQTLKQTKVALIGLMSVANKYELNNLFEETQETIDYLDFILDILENKDEI